VPTWPTAEGRRAVTLELPATHVEHLDRQAAYEGMSRAAYIRQLVLRDFERYTPNNRRRTAKA
jgi:hypothetical protein